MQSHKIVKQETRTVIYTVSQKTKLMSDATASMYIKAILTIFFAEMCWKSKVSNGRLYSHLT